MKKLLSIAGILSCALLAGILSSCDDMPYLKKEPKAAKIEDLNSPDFRVGLALGAKSMYVGEEKLPKARPGYFSSHHTAYDDLKRKKIDAYVFDSHTLDYVAATNEEFTVLPGSIGAVDIAIGVTPGKPELLEPINAFIDAYKADGTYNNMYERWIKVIGIDQNTPEEVAIPPMPEIPAPEAPTRKLVVGVCSQLEPMCFHRPGTVPAELVGFDMELLRRLALHLNAEIELHDLDYKLMMELLANGELDMVVAGLNRTAAREESILFSKNYINSRIVALVRTGTAAEKAEYVTPQ